MASDEQEREQQELMVRYLKELGDTLSFVKRTRPRGYVLVLRDVSGSDDPFLLMVHKRRKPQLITAAKREFKDAFGKVPDIIEGTVRLDGRELTFEVPPGAGIPSRLHKYMREQIAEHAGRSFKIRFETVSSLTEADESDDETELEEPEVDGA